MEMVGVRNTGRLRDSLQANIFDYHNPTLQLGWMQMDNMV